MLHFSILDYCFLIYYQFYFMSLNKALQVLFTKKSKMLYILSCLEFVAIENKFFHYMLCFVQWMGNIEKFLMFLQPYCYPKPNFIKLPDNHIFHFVLLGFLGSKPSYHIVTVTMEQGYNLQKTVLLGQGTIYYNIRNVMTDHTQTDEFL